MALNPLVESRDVQFVLFEVLNIDTITKYPKYADFDRDTFIDTLELAEKIALDQFYQVNGEGDKEGAKYNPETKEVKVPECYKEAYKAYADAGFIALNIPQEAGGMGLPEIINISLLLTLKLATIKLFTFMN